MKKEKKPALEINLNLVPLLESLGLGEALERAVEEIQKGKAELLDKLATKVQRGEAEIKLSIGKKRHKLPIVLNIRLKK